MKAAISYARPDVDADILAIGAKLMLQAKVKAADGATMKSEIEGSFLRPRVAEVLRAAVAVGSTDGWGSALVPPAVTAAFVESLGSDSAFYALLPLMLRIPLRTKAVVVTLGATGFVRGEGQVRPISRLSLASSAGLVPQEAAAIVIVSDELVKHQSARVTTLFSSELRKAAAAAVDSELVLILDAAATTVPSNGSTSDAARMDLRDALAAMTLGKSSKIAFIANPNVAAAASLLGDGATSMFPGMTPTGGEMMGAPVFTSDAVEEGALYVLDASRLAGNSDAFRFEILKEATLQIDSAPDSPPTAATTMINLYLENKAALIARCYFAAEVISAGAVVKLTDISWGDPTST